MEGGRSVGESVGRLRVGLAKSTLGRALMAPLGRDLSPQRWIFLVGCYSSGTTLLRSIMARHPEIAALPSEGVKLTSGLPAPEQFGWHRMWSQCVNQVRLDPHGGDRRAATVRRHWSLALPAGATNILEKSIANTARLPFLQAHFQPAHIICLVRNGSAVAEGIRRKSEPGRRGNTQYPDKYPIGLCADQWCVSDNLVEGDRPGLQRFLQVRYEDLTARPAEVLRQITDFLELSPLPGESTAGEWIIHGVRSEVRNMNQQSLDRLSRQDLDEINSVAADVLTRHGYEIL